MAETSTILTTRRHVRAGYVMLIEGIPLALCSDADTAGLKTAHAGTDWASASATFRAGLDLRASTLKQSIDPFKPEVHPPALTVRVVDKHGEIGSRLLQMRPSTTADWTELTADLDNDDTTANVLDTSQFDSSGEFYLGGETIGYSGKTGTTFTGLTRAKYSLWANSAAADFGRYHRIDTTKNVKPRVSKWPRNGVYNRGVSIYMHHKGEGQAGIWSVRSQAKLVFTGRIKSVVDEQDGSFTFHLLSIMELLQAELLGEQFTADVSEGIYLTAAMSAIKITEHVQGSSAVSDETTLTSGQRYTYRQLIDEITSKISGFSTIDKNWAAVVNPDGYVKIAVDDEGATDPTTNTTHMLLGLHPIVWEQLGFGDRPGTRTTESISSVTYAIEYREIPRTGYGTVARWELGASELPILYNVAGSRVYVEGAKGVWAIQPSSALTFGGIPASAEGLIAIGDSAVWAVEYESGSDYFTLHRDVTSYFNRYGYQGAGGLPGVVREGEQGRLQVRQVWYEPAATLADLVLRMLLSTGTTDYNSSTYDKNPFNMGAAVPYSVVDVNGFLELGSYSAPVYIDRPTPLTKVLNSICATYGFYVMLDTENGKITLRPLQLSGVNIAATWTLTESNKARRDDVSVIDYGTDGIVNKFELKHGRNLKGDFSETVIVEDIPSITDFGERRKVTVEAWCIGIGEQQHQLADDWVARVAAQGAIAARPQTRLTRSFNYSLLDMMPCDTATVSDPKMIDPADGERGVSSLPAIVVETAWNLGSLTGMCTLAMWPDLNVDRTAKWGPAARVDEGASNAGYVVVSGSERYLACKTRQYAHSSQGVDVSFFAAGDKIDIIELSPTNPASPTRWERTVESVDEANNRIYLTAALSSPAWNTLLKYIVTHSAIDTPVQTSQKAYAFIALEGDNSTGAAPNDAYVWGGGPPSGGGQVTRTYTEKYQRQHHLLKLPDVDSRSLDVAHFHGAILGLNNAWAYKTRSAPVRFPYLGNKAAGAADGLVIYPIWVPLYHWGRRNLKIKVLVATSAGTATFTARAAAARPTGAYNAPSWGDATTVTDTAATSSASYEWKDLELDFVASGVPLNMFTPPGVWLTIQCDTTNGALQSLCVSEAEGS